MVGGNKGDWALLLAFGVIGVMTTIAAIVFGVVQLIRWIF